MATELAPHVGSADAQQVRASMISAGNARGAQHKSRRAFRGSVAVTDAITWRAAVLLMQTAAISSRQTHHEHWSGDCWPQQWQLQSAAMRCPPWQWAMRGCPLSTQVRMVLTAISTGLLLQTAEHAAPARLSTCAGFLADPARCERAYVGNTLGMVSLSGAATGDAGHPWIALSFILAFAAARNVSCSIAHQVLPAGQCSVRQAAGPAQVCFRW